MSDNQPSLDVSAVAFDDSGLVPCVVQEWTTGEVLMVAWMSRESLERTIATGTTWFWSRSREKLWNKGETSGNYQKVHEIRLDCDADTLLALVEQTGPACHTGTGTCFEGRLLYSASNHSETDEGERDIHRGRYAAAAGGGAPFLAVEDLYRIIRSRKQAGLPESYTARLFEQGISKMGEKITEEAGELAEAAEAGDRAHALYEAGDLMYHLLVLLAELELTPADLAAELERRKG
ncbi:MAG: bifunctional phosphoribosyl-AMP cyclohydrolase/phosphoribosyl-ATP diphosphatase HisIE [Thermoleophilia bacterium]